MSVVIYKNKNLSSHSTFGMHANAYYYLEFDQRSDLLDVSEFINQTASPSLSLGHGSNMIFCSDYPGVVVHNTASEIKRTSQHLIHADAGVHLDQLVQWTLDQGLFGLEALSGIPGTVGGAVALNAGAYGAMIRDYISSVRVFDVDTNELMSFDRSELHYWHRSSVFREKRGNNWIIVDATFKLSKKPRSFVHPKLISDKFGHELRQDILHLRSHFPDPSIYRNAGSFFLNPTVPNSVADVIKERFPDCVMRPYDGRHQQIAAGWLLETNGLKGSRYKGFYISDLHANMVINENPSATGVTLIDFIRFVQQRIYEMFHIHIVAEPLLVGEEFLQGKLSTPTLSSVVRTY